MPSEAHDAIVKMMRAGTPLAPDPDGSFDIEAIRQGLEDMVGAAPTLEGVRYQPVEVAGVSAEWADADASDASKVLLYLHGGGYVIGSIATHRALVGRLAQAAGIRGLSIDYRMGPEHPFPAAVEDAVAVYRYLLAEGIPAANIAIGGDSAGGGLTFATLLALKDAGVPLPGAAIALSPWVDLEGLGESMQTKADADPMVTREGLLMMAGLYLNGADPKHPHAAPLYGDLSGLPPILVQVGTAETLLDDSIRITERAREAGVAIELQQFEDLVHVFQTFAPVPEALDAIEKLGAFLKQHL